MGSANSPCLHFLTFAIEQSLYSLYKHEITTTYLFKRSYCVLWGLSSQCRVSQEKPLSVHMLSKQAEGTNPCGYMCIRVLASTCWCKILNFPRKYSLSALYQSMTRAGSIPVLMLDIEFPKSQRVNVNVNVNVWHVQEVYILTLMM